MEGSQAVTVRPLLSFVDKHLYALKFKSEALYNKFFKLLAVQWILPYFSCLISHNICQIVYFKSSTVSIVYAESKCQICSYLF